MWDEQGPSMKAATTQMTGSPGQAPCPHMLEWRIPGKPWPCLATPSWCHEAAACPEQAEIPAMSGASLMPCQPHSPHPTITVPGPTLTGTNALLFQNGSAGLWLPDSLAALTSRRPSHKGPWGSGFPGLEG